MSTSFLSGGIHSSAEVWFSALAIFTLVTLGMRFTVYWAFFVALHAFSLYWLPKHGIVVRDFENPDYKTISWAIAFSSSLLLTLSMLHGFFAAHRRAIRNLDQQAHTLIIQADHLRHAKLEAESASRSRSEFIATVSHEIRTPMNGILGVAQLLASTELNSEQNKYLGALRMSAEGLLSILNDILDFSKIEAGKLEINPEPFDIKDLCEDCLGLFAGITQSKDLKISLFIEPTISSYLLGDGIRIRQILINLLGNAIKFTEKGIVQLDLRPATGQPKKIRFTVKDEGIGMSDSTLKKLFQPYTQADGTSTRKYGGTGLGLAICNRLVGLMGGNIGVTSQLGLGSEFYIEIPLPKAENPKNIKAELNSEVGTISPIEIRTDYKSIQHILLVEDNAVNRLIATKMLEKLGATTEIAINGVEAVEKWQSGKFDLIFMDCQMPEMDGYEATRKIRELEIVQKINFRIPIVALTAHAMEEDRKHCLEAGMDEYLSKPVKAESLRLALDTWVKKGG